MGETASGFQRLTMTGTLTLRYRSPLPLGPTRMEAWIDGEEGRKVTVEARIGVPGAPPAVEATGLFIIPSWAAARWRNRPAAPRGGGQRQGRRGHFGSWETGRFWWRNAAILKSLTR